MKVAFEGFLGGLIAGRQECQKFPKGFRNSRFWKCTEKVGVMDAPIQIFNLVRSDYALDSTLCAVPPSQHLGFHIKSLRIYNEDTGDCVMSRGSV